MMDQVYFEFPEGAVLCASGDYLIGSRPGGGWHVYRVEDLLLLNRLVALTDHPSTTMIEEHLHDSTFPAYSGEVHLLLTAFAALPSESLAIEAIHDKKLTEKVRGLLRPAREFPEPTYRVFRPAAESE